MAKTVDILVFDEAVLSSTAAPLDMFSRVNDVLIARGKSPAFSVGMVGAQAQAVSLGAGAAFRCDRRLDELSPSRNRHRSNLIVIPAFSGDWDTLLTKYPDLPALLKHHYERGTEIASLCRGSYFLAEAGLLDGIPCTSHWASIDDMRRRYPRIHLQPDAVVTDHNGLYTGGGAFSSLNLVLYLVEKFCGHDMGVQMAKNFSIQRDHVNQSHFAIFSGMARHSDDVIRTAQDIIERDFGSLASIDEIASRVAMSRRNFIRRFKQAVHMTPLEYLQRVKIEAAKKALEQNQPNIQALVNDVGYNDVKTFRQTFKRLTGLTPKAYREKYGRRLAV